ncbi:MAG: hypothetical protein CL772_04710 [Chloroflexi bacterium]|nr:hypothetical protein [Chloroflexota bacterium]|tara:strand:+ start:96977 stop:97579 length:603 start_codon:yes stop_codon:yes gene_type:complete
MSDFVFATSSPRRIELLKKINLKFKFVPHEFEENNELDIGPYELLVLNSEKKSRSILKKYPKDTILASDTIVYKDRVIGKPKNKMEALKIINFLNDSFHTVMTSIVAINNQGIIFSGVKTSLVITNNISTDKINKYIESEYYADKAGGYGIQNKNFDFVKKYYGCYENILGLPTCLIKECLSIINIDNDYNFSNCIERNR